MNFSLSPGHITEPVSGRTITPAELLDAVRCTAGGLQSLGVGRGDRVVLLFGNNIDFFVCLLAVWKVGACAVPSDSRLTDYERVRLIEAAEPKLVLADNGAQLAATITMTPDALLSIEHDFTECNQWLDDDALILFTSGSTGNPKGVVHTHRSLSAKWSALSNALPLDEFERTLCLLPTHFGHGLICNCLFPLLAGKGLFIAPPFKPEMLMKLGELLDKHQITFMSSVPSMWKLALIASKPPATKSLKRIHCGSAPLSASAWNAIKVWAGAAEVSNVYGITETGSWIAGQAGTTTSGDGLIGEGWGTIIKVLKLDNTNKEISADDECLPGEEGFVWLNTPSLMKGYFQQEETTQAAVKDGWFLTGDIGCVDENGMLTLRGRVRDEINKGGMKIYPADIDVIIEQFAGVKDVCTFAIPDDTYNQLVGVAVVLDTPASGVKELYSWVQERLAAHKMPSKWWILDSIPRTSRGKINRDNVRDVCVTHPHERF